MILFCVEKNREMDMFKYAQNINGRAGKLANGFLLGSGLGNQEWETFISFSI